MMYLLVKEEQSRLVLKQEELVLYGISGEKEVVIVLLIKCRAVAH